MPNTGPPWNIPYVDPTDLVVDYPAADEAQADAVADALDTTRFPAGTVIHHAADTAPTGFVKANGAALSRTTFADLFAAIGTVFGAGDGTTTFNVPDLRGEFVRGFDDGRAVDSGRVFGSAQGDLFRSHSHNLVQRTGSGTKRFPPLAANTGTVTSLRTDNEGGAETRPRNVALLACIKF